MQVRSHALLALVHPIQPDLDRAVIRKQVRHLIPGGRLDVVAVGSLQAPDLACILKARRLRGELRDAVTQLRDALRALLAHTRSAAAADEQTRAYRRQDTPPRTRTHSGPPRRSGARTMAEYTDAGYRRGGGTTPWAQVGSQ